MGAFATTVMNNTQKQGISTQQHVPVTNKNQQQPQGWQPGLSAKADTTLKKAGSHWQAPVNLHCRQAECTTQELPHALWPQGQHCRTGVRAAAKQVSCISIWGEQGVIEAHSQGGRDPALRAVSIARWGRGCHTLPVVLGPGVLPHTVT